MTDNEMVGWYHRLNGHEFKHAPEAVGQGGLSAALHGLTRVEHD